MERQVRPEMEALLLHTLRRSPLFADDIQDIAYMFSGFQWVHKPHVVLRALHRLITDNEKMRALVDTYLDDLRLARERREAEGPLKESPSMVESETVKET